VEAGLSRQVEMAVVQARNDARLLQVEDARGAFRERQDGAVGAGRKDAAVADRDRADVAAGLGGDAGVVKDQVGRARLGPRAPIDRRGQAGGDAARQHMTTADHDWSLSNAFSSRFKRVCIARWSSQDWAPDRVCIR
jgi:hypothetical protein